MKKILIVSTVSRQFYLFEKGNIEVLKSLGYEVHAAANYSDANERLDSLDIIKHHFDIERSPFSLKNIKAYRQLKKLMKSEKFDAVHCHSPMGGVLARFAAKAVGISNVVYTAHGFHFYKGAPLINWLAYYPIEKLLSRYTDVLITINQEDYKSAQKFSMKNLRYIPGIGVDTEKISESSVNRDKKRTELGISNGSVVILSIGEMIKRKNHKTAITALAQVKNLNFVYLICGRGELESELRTLSRKLGVEDRVKFLGYRNDIDELCKTADIFLFPSYQEGLPVSVMEAMSAGLPVICSMIRGNTDLIKDGIGGHLLEPNDVDGFSNAIVKLASDENLRRSMGKYNLRAAQKYDMKNIKKIVKDIYSEVLKR